MSLINSTYSSNKIKKRYTIGKNLPKTFDQLIFCKYLVNVLKFTKYLVNVHKSTKYLVNSYHQNTIFLLIETKLHQFSKFVLIVQ